MHSIWAATRLVGTITHPSGPGTLSAIAKWHVSEELMCVRKWPWRHPTTPHVEQRTLIPSRMCLAMLPFLSVL